MRCEVAEELDEAGVCRREEGGVGELRGFVTEAEEVLRHDGCGLLREAEGQGLLLPEDRWCGPCDGGSSGKLEEVATGYLRLADQVTALDGREVRTCIQQRIAGVILRRGYLVSRMEKEAKDGN